MINDSGYISSSPITKILIIDTHDVERITFESQEKNTKTYASVTKCSDSSPNSIFNEYSGQFVVMISKQETDSVCIFLTNTISSVSYIIKKRHTSIFDIRVTFKIAIEMAILLFGILFIIVYLLKRRILPKHIAIKKINLIKMKTRIDGPIETEEAMQQSKRDSFEHTLDYPSLDRKTLDEHIPKRKYREIVEKKAQYSISSCAICLEQFEEIQVLRKIKICKHYFHSECIEGWLKHQEVNICLLYRCAQSAKHRFANVILRYLVMNTR